MGCRYVYFVRHGQSEANVDSRFGLDLPLTEQGIEEALFAGTYFKDHTVSNVVSSDMKRAVFSMFYMFPERNSFFIDRRFREIYFGRLEGVPVSSSIISELQRDPMRIREKYRGDDVWTRADKALAALRNYILLSSGDLAVVGHDTLFECMLELSGYYDLANGGTEPFLLWSDKCRMKNGSVIQLESGLFFK